MKEEEIDVEYGGDFQVDPVRLIAVPEGITKPVLELVIVY